MVGLIMDGVLFFFVNNLCVSVYCCKLHGNKYFTNNPSLCFDYEKTIIRYIGNVAAGVVYDGM